MKKYRDPKKYRATVRYSDYTDVTYTITAKNKKEALKIVNNAEWADSNDNCREGEVFPSEGIKTIIKFKEEK